MINAATITAAMEAQLKAALPSDYRVERGEYVNMDYQRVPWVGVYRGELNYDTATLGRGTNSWRAQFVIKLIVQAATLKANAADAEDDLEAYIEAVLDAVMADKTIGGTVAMVSDVSIVYGYNEGNSEEVYFQSAVISITTEVRTQ